MPYTQAQLRHVSSRFNALTRGCNRRMDNIAVHYAVNNVMWTLRNYERESQWEIRCALEADDEIICPNCGEVFGFVTADGERVYRNPDDIADTPEETYCCHECANNDDWVTCERCGDWVRIDDSVYVESSGYYYCSERCAERDGYIRCYRCEEWTHESDAWEVEGDLWCEHCANNYTTRCERCDELFDDDNICYCEEFGGYLCECCADEYAANHLIHEYGFTPRLTYFDVTGPRSPWTPKPPLFLGTELETDSGRNRDAYAKALNALPNFAEHFWMTHDSSLDNGVEITSMPMTLGMHVKLMDVYKSIRQEALQRDFKSHDSGNNGLHVHVNRRWFGEDKRLQDAGGYKLMRLMQRFERQFYIFSRRTSTRWCDYKTSRDYKIHDDAVKILRSGKDESGPIQKAEEMTYNACGHSQAVNFEHTHTFEIRIFRGTLKLETYFASLGLVNGLCHTVKHHGSVWVESVNWYDLINEVIERCDEPYAAECLANYIDSKGLR